MNSTKPLTDRGLDPALFRASLRTPVSFFEASPKEPPMPVTDEELRVLLTTFLKEERESKIDLNAKRIAEKEVQHRHANEILKAIGDVKADLTDMRRDIRGVEARVSVLESRFDATRLPAKAPTPSLAPSRPSFDLGRHVSDSGMHVRMTVEEAQKMFADEHLREEGRTWHWIKSNATSVTIGVLTIVIAGAVATCVGLAVAKEVPHNLHAPSTHADPEH
jgi:hypothetical protein